MTAAMNTNKENDIKTESVINVMDHLGQEIVIDGITYDLPTAEQLSCADLRVVEDDQLSEEV